MRLQHLVSIYRREELPEVHNMIKQVTHFVVHREFWHHESLGRLIIDYMGVKRRREHVIQSSANRIGWSSHRRYLSLLLW